MTIVRNIPNWKLAINTFLIVLNICICSIVFWENNLKRFCSGCEEYCFPKVVQVLIETIYFLKVFGWFQGEKKLICLNLLNIKNKIWRKSLISFKRYIGSFVYYFKKLKATKFIQKDITFNYLLHKTCTILLKEMISIVFHLKRYLFELKISLFIFPQKSSLIVIFKTIFWFIFLFFFSFFFFHFHFLFFFFFIFHTFSIQRLV